MKIVEILALYDEQERIRKERPLYQREMTAEVVRLISQDPSQPHFVMYSQLNESNADEIIQREKAYYPNMGGAGLEWMLYEHDEPADLGERLRQHGFVPGAQEGLLVADLQEWSEVYQQPITADADYQIRRLVTSEEIGQLVQLQAQVYGQDFSQLQTELEENLMLEPDGWAIYGAYAEGQLVCGAWISFPPKSSFATLSGGATLKAYRQRGLYLQMVATRALMALARGYRFLLVYAGDMSRPILLKRGFRSLTHTYVYVWLPEP
ncbi:MAG: GNAT family N-acetyltransferase [Ardenticatenaceae bacterium]|nr:GNAT family N-acetyltransferase [Ardenticatenaceae bacterium]